MCRYRRWEPVTPRPHAGGEGARPRAGAPGVGAAVGARAREGAGLLLGLLLARGCRGSRHCAGCARAPPGRVCQGDGGRNPRLNGAWLGPGAPASTGGTVLCGAVCGDGGDGDGGSGGALAPGIRLCCRALTSGPPGDPAAVWCPGKGCRGRASASARGIRGQRVGHVAALAGRPRRPPGLWLG